MLTLRKNDTVQVFRSQGLLPAARFAMHVVKGIIKERSGASRRPKLNAIDTQYGTDTAANVRLHGLDIRSPNYEYAVYYRATDFPILTEILQRLRIRHADYTFVDYGSGKGLVILQAAAYPFRQVICVEFARELHEIARRNVEIYPRELLRTGIELIYGDAVEFSPPPGNLVLYLYEPFEAPVARQVITQIQKFRHGRDVVVAYVWSKNQRVSCKSVWDAQEFLARVAEGDSWTIYRAV